MNATTTPTPVGRAGGSRLTAPQRALLAELVESSTGGLWIGEPGRYARTARALVAKGYARAGEWADVRGRHSTWFEPVVVSEAVA